MKVIEFKTKKRIKSIYIPKKFREELKDSVGKIVRVVILLDDQDSSDDQALKQATRE